MSYKHELRCAKSLMVGAAKMYCRICQKLNGRGLFEPLTVSWRDMSGVMCCGCIVRRIIRGETEFRGKKVSE